ncbi:MAG: NAD(P)-binding domain-containing protein [Methanobacterium sp.]|nr:NAD(P)-binding domain-containing protein [Methanobacterium sp.]
MERKFGFIGGGRITKIFLTGFKKAGISLDNVIVSDKNTETLNALKNEFPEIRTVDDNKIAASQDIVFISLHPPVMGDVLNEIKSNLKSNATVISLAPKIKMAKISEILGNSQNIVRMIPNAPSIVNEGYNPVLFSSKMDETHKEELLDMFKVLGDCPEVDESKLEAYALITAIGPTYFWFQLDELQKLGKSFGLTEKEIQEGMFNMLNGATKTFFHSELTPEEVMDLIPVKPLENDEEDIRTAYQLKLETVFDRLK